MCFFLLILTVNHELNVDLISNSDKIERPNALRSPM